MIGDFMINRLLRTVIFTIMLSAAPQALGQGGEISSKVADSIIFIKNLIVQHPYVASAVGVEAFLQLNGSSIITFVKNLHKKYPKLVKLAGAMGIEGFLRYNGTTAITPLKRLCTNHPYVMTIIGIGYLLEMYNYLDITDKLRTGYQKTIQFFDNVTNSNALVRPVTMRTQMSWGLPLLQSIWSYAKEYPTPALMLLAIPGIPWTAKYTRHLLEHPKVTGILSKSLNIPAMSKNLQSVAKISAFYPLVASFLTAAAMPLTGDPIKKFVFTNEEKPIKNLSNTTQYENKRVGPRPATVENLISTLKNFLETAKRTILLHGIPGTGKTVLAIDIADACDATTKNGRLVVLLGADLMVGDRKFGYGSTVAKDSVTTIIEKAANNPDKLHFVVLEEVHTMAGDRSGTDNGGGVIEDKNARAEMVRHLLDQINDENTHKNIVVIGTTNFTESMDAGIKNQFKQRIEINPPEFEVRKSILANKIKEKSCNITAETLNYIAQNTEEIVSRNLVTLADSICTSAKQYFKEYASENDAIVIDRSILGGAINKAILDEIDKTIKDHEEEIQKTLKVHKDYQSTKEYYTKHIEILKNCSEVVIKDQHQLMLNNASITLKKLHAENQNLTQWRREQTKFFTENFDNLNKLPEQEELLRVHEEIMKLKKENKLDAQKFAEKIDQLKKEFDPAKQAFSTSLNLQHEIITKMITSLTTIADAQAGSETRLAAAQALMDQLAQLRAILTYQNIDQLSDEEKAQENLLDIIEQGAKHVITTSGLKQNSDDLNAIADCLKDIGAKKQIFDKKLRDAICNIDVNIVNNLSQTVTTICATIEKLAKSNLSKNQKRFMISLNWSILN